MVELVLGLVAVAALVLAVVFWLRQRSAVARNRELADRVEQLRRYEGIVDAEGEVRAMLAGAQQRADVTVAASERIANESRLEGEATKRRMVAEGEAERIRASADAQELRRQADELVRTSRNDAETIVTAARTQADAIAGDALKTRERAREYQETAEAMRNVIEGYGDRYVVPTFTILDELGDQFGFAEAGSRLKDARQRTRVLAMAGTAATCDYVEAQRRDTAIAFVLDAFNGKVDSVLADVREDNFGTLERRIKDAFTLVNQNGRAFRNARITDEYLGARRDELRWAVAVHELKAKDREEQRLIKERIREEEKAQREFERAQREALKEEEFLRKAMEKARREIERASDEQKAKYEEELQALNEKLRAAEEKNQRALSMAQQTKSGNVYVISNVGSFGEDVFKIGLTRRLEPKDRIRELGDASVPFEFDIHALIRSEDAPALERELHKRFVRSQVNKVNPRKEFFRVSIQDIRQEVERLGLFAQWTMTAECRDWKESQALERALREHRIDERTWEKSQLQEDVGLPDEALLDEAVG